MSNEAVPVSAPELVTLRRVELAKVGDWQLSTGEWNARTEDFYQAVAACDCPAVRSPVLKLGHNGGVGEPALGWIDNLAVVDDGSTLVGDYSGMPRWFAEIIGSAYPSRSIEGYYDFVCGLGHKHPFVLDAVALLGVEHPGVSTIEGLNARSIADLYGVMASADADTRSFVATVKGSEPVPTPVNAQATTQDVLSAFYELPAVELNWWMWCEELFIDPPQIIACDDSDGTLWLYSYEIADDGTVTFGQPEQVRRTYVAAATGRIGAKFASLAESRPKAAAALAARKAFASSDEDNGDETNKEGTTMELANEVRARLGVADDADDATILAALDEALNERADDGSQSGGNSETQPEPVAAGTRPENAPQTVTVDAAQWAEMQRQVAAGVAAREQQDTERRNLLLASAVRDGRISPSGVEKWRNYITAGTPEMRTAAEAELAGLAKNTFPVATVGHSQGSTEALAGENTENAFGADGRVKAGWVVPVPQRNR